MTAGQLSAFLHDNGFSEDLNAGGFARTLDAQPELVRSSKPRGFRVNTAKLTELDEQLGSLTRGFIPLPLDPVYDAAAIASGRGYVLRLLQESNACFSISAYNSFAVLTRRVVEGLIITLYESKGHREAVEHNGQTMLLADLLGIVKQQKPLAFSRGFYDLLKTVKDIGDRAAHHRYHITNRKEAEQIASAATVVMSELAGRL